MKPFKLDNEPRLNAGFKVPEGYFESLEDRVMEQLSLPEPKVIPLYRRRPVWASVAAAVVVMVGAGLFYLNNSATPADESAIENYLVYQGNISSYDIIQNLDDSDINALEKSMAVSDDAVIDYLDNENIIVTD